MLYNINALKIGLKVLHNKEPYIIVRNECIKPGKGLSFNRVRLKKIVSGKILEKTLKSGEFLKSANVIETKLIYLYRTAELWCFMHHKDFEQIEIHSSILRSSIKWMIEQLSYIVTFWNNNPILVTPPEFVQLKIIKTTPIIKNETISASSKLAIVSTGAIIKVPCFIRTGEFIKINTYSSSYVSRAKQ